MKRRYIVLTAFLLSPNLIVAQTDSVYQLTVFYADDVPIVNDIPNGSVSHLEFHNMSIHNNTVKRVNDLVQDEISGLKVDEENVKDIYLRAFSDVQNGPHWREVYEQFEKGGSATEMAFKLGIKKLPAVIINEKYVIYGVSSISHAVEIFDRWSEK
jgi:integrating conjugative element protein (TIGR03757 family)